MERRRYLTLLAGATTVTLAGCTGEDDTETDDGDTDPQNGSDPTNDPGTGYEDIGEDQLQMGETAVYFVPDMDYELAVTPTDSTHKPAIVDGTDPVTAKIPREGDAFLQVPVTIENTGDEPTQTPWDVSLESAGTIYDHHWLDTPVPNKLDRAIDIAPTESMTANLAFRVPEDIETGTIAIDWRADDGFVENEPVTAEWTVTDPGMENDVLGDLTVGEEVVVDALAEVYALAVTDVETTPDQEGDAQRVTVTLEAENTGNYPVTPPGRDEVALVAGGEQYEPVQPETDDAFETRELESGESEHGTVVFELPPAVDAATVRVQLTTALSAEWTV